MTNPELAAEYIKNGFNCAQSIIHAFAKEAGIQNEEELLLMTSTLGGGIGRNGFVCGAITGSALIIGKLFGNKEPDDFQSREIAYEFLNSLIDEFKQIHGGIMCGELISVNMRDKNELAQARENGVFQTKCPEFLFTAGKILDDIIKLY